MKIVSVTDPSFAPYGKIVTGYDTAPLVRALAAIPLPADGVAYVASVPALESLPVAGQLHTNFYGGMPVQLGYCGGHNTKLNCLEYHRDSEMNLGSTDFVLLLAKQDEIVNGTLDTAKVKAFYCPAGVMVEVYATTLHYAPCGARRGEGFMVCVGLPKGTNGKKPEIAPLSEEDKTLFARNKWLLAHAESGEASQGAVVGLTGINIDIEDSL